MNQLSSVADDDDSVRWARIHSSTSSGSNRLEPRILIDGISPFETIFRIWEGLIARKVATSSYVHRGEVLSKLMRDSVSCETVVSTRRLNRPDFPGYAIF